MSGAVFDVVFMRDGSRIGAVSNDGTIRLWDLATGEVSGNPPPQPGVDQRLCVSPDGRWLASSDASSGVVHLWDLVEGRPGPTWNSGGRNAAGMVFTGGGRTIALGDATGAVRLWSVDRGTSRTVSFPDHRVVTVVALPGGALCLLESPSRTMSLHDLETGRRVELEGGSSQTGAACSSDGRRLATIDGNGAVHLWDTESGHPVWRTVALLRSPFELLTHRGRIPLADTRVEDDLDPGTGEDRGLPGVAPRGSGTLRWRGALEDRARTADQYEDGRWLCVLDHQDTVELWDLEGDTRSWSLHIPKAVAVNASRDGCVVRGSNGRVLFIERSGLVTTLAANGTAVEVSAGRVFVASGEGIAVFDTGGNRVSVLEAPPGVTAIGVADSYLAVGTEDGTMAFVSRDPMAEAPTCTIEGLPSSPIERIVPDPGGTIVVGLEDGTLGIWNLEDGDLLHRTHLNGAVRHSVLDRGVLVAATRTGDYATLDLRLFASPYCEVLREVWEETEVVWSSGRPEHRPIPKSHACSH